MGFERGEDGGFVFYFRPFIRDFLIFRLLLEELFPQCSFIYLKSFSSLSMDAHFIWLYHPV